MRQCNERQCNLHRALLTRQLFRRVFRVALGLFVAGLALWSAVPVRADDAAERRAQAKQQFARAEKLRAELEAKPEGERSVRDYAQLVSGYRRVYLIKPHVAEAPKALRKVGDLYRIMGTEFERKYFQSAVETYEFLLHEYPTNSYRKKALLAIAAIRRNYLAQSNLAREQYEEFLQRYPDSADAGEARRALAEMDAEERLATDARLPRVPSSAVAAARAKATDDSSQTSHIRVWNADTYTRVVIELGGQAKYQAARISNPDRIYFDIEGAKLSRELVRGPVGVPPGGYLKAVRVGLNRPDVVRVVLDVVEVKDYSVFQLANPDRLVVDVYDPNAGTESTGAATAQIPSSIATANVASRALSTTTTPAQGNVAARTAALPPALPVRETARALGPAPVPEPTRSGERSLTRVLGLKVGRIAIDPGHGGYDTGTIGPSGLMEKDLSMDVALRLGKLIRHHLPGADVIYTREDDSFVPLERRTAAANEARADLFLSIHANSSGDHSVSGIETYYLNFNASSDAMEVAARENAVAQRSIHDLPTLVQEIASNEKIEESRDLAVSIQDSLAKRMERQAKDNRGVRKAPFIVLIGAKMPSVLTEISFLSNPADEMWLKKPENRQRVAEGLYAGIESYLQSTNSLALNLTPPAAE